jgi:hypothetical protein
MGVPTSEVGYTSATTRRESIWTCGGIGVKKYLCPGKNKWIEIDINAETPNDKEHSNVIQQHGDSVKGNTPSYCIVLRHLPSVGQELLIHEFSTTHITTRHSREELFWTSDQLVVETSTWQYTTITTEDVALALKHLNVKLPRMRLESPDGGSCIALHSLNLGARRGGWSAPRPGRFTPGKDPVSIVEEDGWAPGPVWTCAKNLAPTLIRSPDRPARCESLYRLSYPATVETCRSDT